MFFNVGFNGVFTRPAKTSILQFYDHFILCLRSFNYTSKIINKNEILYVQYNI